MNLISLKLKENWLSLQKGFQWNDIPPLAIITGINGVGKTHLVELLKSDQDDNIEILSNDKPYKLALPHPNNGMNLENLIKYFKETSLRLDLISNLKGSVRCNEVDIEKFIKERENAKSEGERETHNRTIANRKEALQSAKRGILNAKNYTYEQELTSIADFLNIEVKDLTEDLIREHANPVFNDVTEIDDFISYIKIIENYRNDIIIKLSKEKKFKDIEAVENKKKIHEIINDFFTKYEFDYFVMKDPYPADRSIAGELLFEGKKGELINYSSLSSGEQMIVKLIIWAMSKDIRGKRVNTMILDEPDAHLHPAMCKMMIEILENISTHDAKGGIGVRVIITTHSLSTVAFAPEDSLFAMTKDESGNRIISKVGRKEAINSLSEGVLTFENIINSFGIISHTSKQNILCVEGKTDVIHINTAMEKLHKELDIEVVNLYNAANVAEFVRSIPNSLLGGKKIIGLFDRDNEGRKYIQNYYEKLRAYHCSDKAFYCLLPSPCPSIDKYCPIEYLYSKEILEKNSVLQKRNYSEYNNMFKAPTPEEQKDILDDYERERTLRPFKTNDNVKYAFSQFVSSLDKNDFNGFIPLFDLLSEIISDKEFE